MSRENAVQNFWSGLAARERTGITVAGVVLSATLLWGIFLSPALQIVRAAPAQAARLQAQWQTMHSLQREAQALQAQPKLGRVEALRALEASVQQRLGASAQLSVQGERASLVLKGASAQALAQWLAQARINARVLPTEARLQRSVSTAPGAPASAAAGATWDGTLVLALPAR